MKIYEVFLNDIWNNNYLLGFYKDLDDAIEDINAQIYDEKYHLQKGDVKEYSSTFNSCFDVSVGEIYCSKHQDDESTYFDELEDMWVRGFILDSDSLLEELKKMKG